MEKPNLTQLKELPGKWKRDAQEAIPEDYKRSEYLRGKYLKMDTYAAAMDDCADELEPLLASLLAEREAVRVALQNAVGLADALDAIIQDWPQIAAYLPGLASCRKNIEAALAEVPGE